MIKEENDTTDGNDSNIKWEKNLDKNFTKSLGKGLNKTQLAREWADKGPHLQRILKRLQAQIPCRDQQKEKLFLLTLIQ